MRGSLLVASLVLVAATAGCFGADVHVEPRPSDPASSSQAQGPQNEPPIASFIVLNETGQYAVRHYTGENISADASASRDPDGSITNYTWRVLRFGYFDPEFGDQYGPRLDLRFDSPGDRTLVLQVRDDQGATRTDYVSFAVNQHRIESGRVILGQVADVPQSDPVASPVGAKNFSLEVVEGVLALSINATFPADPTALVRLEIRAPNGTLLNRSEGAQAPLWAIAAPLPGVVGNYTAHLGLVTGVATEYRMEFVAWYGFS